MWQDAVHLPGSEALAEQRPVHPSRTLAEIFGPGLWYNQRPSYRDAGFLGSDPYVLDATTGSPLGVAGDMPVLVNRALLDPRALRLLERAGLALAPNFVVYDGAHEYEEALQAAGRKWALQFPHPVDEVPPENLWVPRALVCYLNNKGSLPELVTASCVPNRKPLQTMNGRVRHAKYPVVVKAASDAPNASGGAVRICRSAQDVQRACLELGERNDLFLEEFLPLGRSLNIQFCVLPSGAVEYLGTSEQVTDAAGHYHGNLLTPGCRPRAATWLACRLAVERAAGMGYRGVAGIDAAELDDGRVYLFDLNFRINGSTFPLLLAPAASLRYGRPVFRSRGWSFAGSFEAMLEHIAAWIDQGRYLPLSIYRSPDGVPPRTAGMLMAGNRPDMQRIAEAWAALGFG